MTCPHCGAEVMVGSAFCQRCRKRVVAGASAPPPTPYARPQARGDAPRGVVERPRALRALAILEILLGLLLLGVGGFLGFVLVKVGRGGDVMPVVMVAVFLLMGLLYLAAGIGVLRLASWGRVVQMLIAGLSLLSIPLGTVFGALLLVYFRKRGVARLFEEPSPRLSPEEAEQVQGTGVLVAANVIASLSVVAVFGIVAAIAIPSLLRARVAANEQNASADLQQMFGYQETYARKNGGFYDTPDCLAAPARCIPNYGAGDPFTDMFVASTRHGYTFQFHAGPKPEGAPPNVSPSSVTSYAYVAAPAQPGRSGIRAFCIDSKGRMCRWRDGRVPPIEGGACPESCGMAF